MAREPVARPRDPLISVCRIAMRPERMAVEAKHDIHPTHKQCVATRNTAAGDPDCWATQIVVHEWQFQQFKRERKAVKVRDSISRYPLSATAMVLAPLGTAFLVWKGCVPGIFV